MVDVFEVNGLADGGFEGMAEGFEGMAFGVERIADGVEGTAVGVRGFEGVAGSCGRCAGGMVEVVGVEGMVADDIWTAGDEGMVEADDCMRGVLGVVEGIEGEGDGIADGVDGIDV